MASSLSLDHILFEMKEPDRTNTLREWVPNDEPVLIKPSKGTFVEMIGGEKVTVPPKGKYFGRRSAVHLLLDFGEQGKYIGMHRATGITDQWLEARPHDEQKFWRDEKGVKVRDQYLYHAVAEDDQEEDAIEKALTGVAN